MVDERINNILGVMNFRGEDDGVSSSLRDSRGWDGLIQWLDSSGLALYFLHTLERKDLVEAIPPEARAQLEHRRRKNSQRMELLQKTFETLNRDFFDAGIEYTVLKGFSLIPDYCPDVSLRAQGDLDYLVGPDAFAKASCVLRSRGYQLKTKKGQESVFWIPSQEPISSAVQYDPDSPYVIELHSSLWDESRFLVPQLVPGAMFDQKNTRAWRSGSFPCLSEPAIFLNQILHAFQHVITGRVRLCHLFEIAYFLRQRADDDRFWMAVEGLLCYSSLRDALGLVSSMVSTVFPGPRAVIVKQCSDEIAPEVRLWVKHYSRRWLIEGGGDAFQFLSNAKLIFFLQQQYTSKRQKMALALRSLAPVAGVRRFGNADHCHGSRYRTIWQNRRRMLARLKYHLGADLRYLSEVPRWRRLKKAIGFSSFGVQPLAEPETAAPPGSAGQAARV